MKSRTLKFAVGIVLLAELATPFLLAAQNTQFAVVDTGTLGGPNSFLGFEQSRNINNRGTIAASTDTAIPANPPFCFNDCNVEHTTRWQNGVLTDLGTIPNGSGGTSWISDSGFIAGLSFNGLLDPLTGAPELQGVLWDRSQVIALGTLGGNESNGESVNSRGEVVGFALNTIPDPFSGFGTQMRAFLWRDGKMQDLDTLGGPDANAFIVNEGSQVTGYSLTNSTPNATTGFPTQEPFLWKGGSMITLGTLGGTFGFPNWLNNRGQVVGQSDLAGDFSFHPFLWEGSALRDLGTLGGDFGTAYSISESGDVVGWSTTPGDSAVHAFLWSGGTITDLGVLEGEVCSVAYAVNTKRQVVGYSDDDCNHGNAHAFLWENGVMIDLNSFVPPDSGVQLTFALSISERGEIATLGLLPNGDQHVFAVMPTGQKAGLSASTTKVGHPGNAVSRPTPSDLITRIRVQMGKRYRTPARGGAWK